MNNRLIFTCLLLAFCGLNAKESNNSDEKAMLKDVEGIRNVVSVRYAPAQLKKELFDWDVDSIFDLVRQQIVMEKPKNVKAFQNIIKSAFLSAKDYHAQVMFYSTEQACFPLDIKGSSGSYFIVPWNGGGYGSSYFNLMEGDDIGEVMEMLASWVGSEVLEIDGIPIQTVVENIIDTELGGDRSPTGYALAEKLVFNRQAALGQTIPSGYFEIALKAQGEDTEKLYTLPWFYTPEEIKDPMRSNDRRKSLARSVSVLKSQTSALDIVNQDYSVPFVADLLARRHFKQKESADEQIDMRAKSFLPQLGRVLWETDLNDCLYAYLYENGAGQRIGYLCIPTFKQDKRASGNILAVMQLFDRESDALVIDVTDNPGGNLFFMYSILAMLTDVPLKALSTEQIITQEDVYSALKLVDLCSDKSMSDRELPKLLCGYPMSDDVRADMRSYASTIIKSWNLGDRMTQRGIGELRAVMPHPKVQYTKPVLVLVNEMSFSCGDIFPAILQDNRRAVIFGKKTAGAGGAVRFYDHSSQMGIAGFSLTNSLVYRLDETPIENRGVTPNIAYEISCSDLQENYVDYIESVNHAIEQIALIPSS
jgi:hypothetical protein